MSNLNKFIFSDVNFGFASPSEYENPILQKSESSKQLERSGSTHSGSSLGTPQSAPIIKETASPFAAPQTPPTVSRSPSVSPGTSSSNLNVGAPLAERYYFSISFYSSYFFV